MQTAHYLTCLWPGLPELWWRGRMSSLPAAIAFAVAVNFVLFARFIFPQWLPAGLVWMAFWVGMIAWGLLIYRNVKDLPEIISPRAASDSPDEFPAAHLAFLRGDWKLAERLLSDVLAIEHRDPPALLLLASIYRLTRRYESADRLIQEISRLESADHWALEVQAEQRLLDRAVQQRDREETEKENSQNEPSSDDAKTGDQSQPQQIAA